MDGQHAARETTRKLNAPQILLLAEAQRYRTADLTSHYTVTDVTLNAIINTPVEDEVE